MRKFFHDLFTGPDNDTYDIGRFLWFQSIQAFIIISFYTIYMGGDLDPIAWGTGLGALLAAGGAAIGLKANSEPKLGDHERREELRERLRERQRGRDDRMDDRRDDRRRDARGDARGNSDYPDDFEP
jgi:hypothetical protein